MSEEVEEKERKFSIFFYSPSEIVPSGKLVIATTMPLQEAKTVQ